MLCNSNHIYSKTSSSSSSSSSSSIKDTLIDSLRFLTESIASDNNKFTVSWLRTVSDNLAKSSSLLIKLLRASKPKPSWIIFNWFVVPSPISFRVSICLLWVKLISPEKLSNLSVTVAIFSSIFWFNPSNEFSYNFPIKFILFSQFNFQNFFICHFLLLVHKFLFFVNSSIISF
ncbi:hypothetical protein LCGC14_3066410, partial [marine sediment metagenome]